MLQNRIFVAAGTYRTSRSRASRGRGRELAGICSVLPLRSTPRFTPGLVARDPIVTRHRGRAPGGLPRRGVDPGSLGTLLALGAEGL